MKSTSLSKIIVERRSLSITVTAPRYDSAIDQGSLDQQMARETPCPAGRRWGGHQELLIPDILPGIDPVAGGARGRRRGVGRGGGRKCEGEDGRGRREGEEFEMEEDALLFLVLILLREEAEEEEG